MPGMMGIPPAPPGDAQPGQVPEAPAGNPSEPAVYTMAQEFIEYWELEPKFKMRMVQHLLKKGDHQAELNRLAKILSDADVPPICRAGFLLVQFGEMNEKHTDEDFKAAILGKPLPSDGDAKKEEEEDEQNLCGDFRLGRCMRGDKCRFSHGKAEKGPKLAEEWMAADIKDFADKHNIDDVMRIRLTTAMTKRYNTFREDMATLREHLRGVSSTKGILSLRLREMDSGTFITRGWSNTDTGYSSKGGDKGGGKGGGWKDKGDKGDRGDRGDRGDNDHGRKASRSRERDRDRKRDRSRSRDRDRDRKKDRSSSSSSSRSRSRSKKRKKSRSRSRSRSRKKRDKDRD